jgi:glycosyltransferase involved in cell wall biosynthesis
MRIFNIIQCANLGGMEQSNLALLAELKAWGHEVELLSLNPIAGMGPLLAKHGIPAEGLAYRGWGGWQSLPQLKRRLGSVHSDALIMTGHNLLAMLAIGDLCRGRRLLKIHFHHTGVKPLWQWQLIYRTALTRFSAIAFPSDFIRHEAEAIFPPISRISHTIGCPIALHEWPTEAERAQARRVLGLPERAHVMGNAGWLIPRKRFDVFLRVARNVAAAEPDALFVIAGRGPEEANLKALANELGIAERVRWLGWQSDLTAFYNSVDLLLFNADWEALGRTPLEGLAAGVPVVCSVLHGGLSEILDSSHYWPIFVDHDVTGLTEASLCVLRDPALAKCWVDAARAHLKRVASTAYYANRVYRLLDPCSSSLRPQEYLQ